MGLVGGATSLRPDQDAHRDVPLSGEFNMLPIRALVLIHLLLDVGGWGLFPHGTVAGIAHLLKIKTYLRKGIK